ncbi:MAG: hypothetical protein IPG85_09965 [Bacteroidetes bacterium]|nr:hypothetical protein [Bacteroidota bacterium]
MSRKIAEQIKIRITIRLGNYLANEFGCMQNEHIYNALGYYNNSDQAIQIRTKAKAMLQQEAKK